VEHPYKNKTSTRFQQDSRAHRYRLCARTGAAAGRAGGRRARAAPGAARCRRRPPRARRRRPRPRPTARRARWSPCPSRRPRCPGTRTPPPARPHSRSPACPPRPPPRPQVHTRPWQTHWLGGCPAACIHERMHNNPRRAAHPLCQTHSACRPPLRPVAARTSVGQTAPTVLGEARLQRVEEGGAERRLALPAQQPVGWERAEVDLRARVPPHHGACLAGFHECRLPAWWPPACSVASRGPCLLALRARRPIGVGREGRGGVLRECRAMCVHVNDTSCFSCLQQPGWPLCSAVGHAP